MHNTLAAKLWSGSESSRLRQALLILGGTLLLAISARVQVPFWPVPMTMQTLMVLAIGACYGTRLGGATVLAYLVEGAIGLPVFAKGAGLAYMVGPTGGYLLGFLVAAIVVGYLVDRGLGRTFASALAVFLIGDALMLALGTAWLAYLIGMEKAIAGGLTPFLPGEAVKIALACVALPMVWRAARK